MIVWQQLRQLLKLQQKTPLRAEKLLNDLIPDSPDLLLVWPPPKLKDSETGKAILGLHPGEARALIYALLPRLHKIEEVINSQHKKRRNPFSASSKRLLHNEHVRIRYITVLDALLTCKLPLEAKDLEAIIQALKDKPEYFSFPVKALIGAIEYFVEQGGQIKKLQSEIRWFREWIGQQYHYMRSKGAGGRQLVDRLDRVLGVEPRIDVQAGEAWSDAARADLANMKGAIANAWNTLLLHCQTGGRGKLTPKWRKQVEPMVAAVGFDSLKDHTLRWFPLVDEPRTKPGRHNAWERAHDQLLIDPHVELLRGLVWCCGFQEDAELARSLGRLALSAYRKIPGKGPRLVSLGNACVTALATMPGQAAIGQLAILKVKVRFGTAQKEIEKAFSAAATREGLPRDEIEELAVPSYGLEAVGVMQEAFDAYQAELVVDGSSARLSWLKEGKPLKSAPAALKKEHPEEFKELQTNVKDINTMLPAQRERIDTLFLAQKTWPLALWRERYLDHPLVGTIARRLLWSFTTQGKSKVGILHDDKIVGTNDKPLDVSDKAVVSLWHPIDRSQEEILGWRAWFEKHEVVQPFKQAHREVYVLTDAERTTRTYSNRFAAHILRQHQFNALCLARGWKNKLRLMVDDEYPPPLRLLPIWNLRAEYWVEGAGSEYGQDTNEAGVFLYLATDQVRFYRAEAARNLAHAGGGTYGSSAAGPGQDDVNEPLILEQIPPLVFSEIMRDVDLFVGVASVGNDPNWADGGPEGRYRDYWQHYSFGELSATAQTRRALLERLLPRLKIADRCALADRFLIVRGSLRSYKIHLGSGNILMTPNDQYLCIVPKQSAKAGDRFFLPFEGDGTLSVIISKAFLLADDTKITDPTIVSQIKK
jgi:hypothetical protein